MFSKQKIHEIEQKLGVVYKNKTLLELAFTHSSYGNINEVENNERLEFLGDSVLHFATTQYLFNNFNMSEGVLSKVRSYVVSAKNLVKAVDELDLIIYLQYGKNETKNTSTAIKANLFEAILASIYLDKGFEAAYQFVIKKLHYTKKMFESLIDNTCDYKTTLQELIQTKRENVLEYKLIKKDGPPHAPIFTVHVLLNKKVMGKGQGNSKKEAENIAAQYAIKKLM